MPCEKVSGLPVTKRGLHENRHVTRGVFMHSPKKSGEKISSLNPFAL